MPILHALQETFGDIDREAEPLIPDAGRISIEPVYCLGLCAMAPLAMLDGRLAFASLFPGRWRTGATANRRLCHP